MSLQLNNRTLREPLREITKTFAIAHHRIRATAHEGRTDILAFHGIGKTANRFGVHYLQQKLAKCGIAMTAIDFPGHGESAGCEAENSLSDRIGQGLGVAQLEQPLTLLGVSMGAFVACSIARKVAAAALVLFCPALYPGRLISEPFGTDFIQRLGRTDWYRESPILKSLQTFEGDLLIVGGKDDPITPPQSFSELYNAARHARSRQLFWLEGCDHSVHAHLKQHHNDLNYVTSKIEELVITNSTLTV